MINLVDIKSALISRGKSKFPDAVATGTSTSLSEDEIKELQWQGTEFNYPTVRLAMGVHQPLFDPQCNAGRINFAWVTFSEKSSSQEADRFADIIRGEFADRPFSSNGVRFSMIRVVGQVPSVRQDRRTWRSEVSLIADVQSGQ